MRESLEQDFERAFSKKTDEELDKEDGEMLKANLLKLLLESLKNQKKWKRKERRHIAYPSEPRLNQE